MEYSARAIQAVQESVVIDMLGLVTLDYRRLCGWLQNTEPFPEAEFQRLRDSGVTVLHPAVGFTDGDVYQLSWNDLARWNQFLMQHPEQFVRVDSVAGMDTAKATGRIGILLGLQNSTHFRTLADVNSFYHMGQRVSQLTYFDNALGGGSASPSRGLTVYGSEVLQRMNALRMAVDVSHCSDRTTLDAIEGSSKPVLVTHSNCRALSASSARCKPDEAIRKLSAKGGVFGVTMVRQFVQPRGPAGMEHVLDHIDHVVAVAGVECAGIGTDVDLDGRDKKQDLDGIQYSRKIFDLAEGLVRRNYSPKDIGLILGGNFRRALADIWLG